MQAVAYAELLGSSAKAAPLAIIQYRDQQREIVISDAHRQRLRETLRAMRKAAETGHFARDHDNSRKCQTCSVRWQCNDRLA